MPELDLTLELVQLYFDYVHNQFHGIFHPPTFIEDVTQGRASEALVFGIIGLGARFSTSPVFADIEPRDRGRLYSAEAERRFNLKDISLETVQLGLLLGVAVTVNGDTAAGNVFYGVSCRVAQLLGLPNRLALTPLQRELDIRGKIPSQKSILTASSDFPVWWALCMVDVWSSAAVKLPRYLPSDVDAPLPMDDLPYLCLPRMGSPRQRPTFERRSPLMFQMVRLNRILLEVNDFNKMCATNHPGPVELEIGVQALIQRMDTWLAELPRDVQDTADNFNWFHVNGLGRTFAAIYLGYYHFGQLLYYQFLHVSSSIPQDSSARTYSSRCKYHSAKLCDMVYRAFSAPGSDVRYLMVAHVLVIASTVQIHTLLFSEDEAQIADSKRRLEKNFEILLHLRPYWPVLDRIMGRLKAFHETCRVNESSSFVLDRWMLQFLVGFGASMDEKPVTPSSDAEAFYTLDAIFQ